MIGPTLSKLLIATLVALGAGAAAAQEIGPLGPAGVPATAFPQPDRPVADIISPIWAHPEMRDGADETGQIVRLLGIKPGMTVADIGAGSGYHTVRLSPVVGPSGRVIAQDVMRDYLVGLAKEVRTRVCRTSRWRSASSTIRGCRPPPSTSPFWSTCITRSNSPSPSCTISWRR